MQPIKCPHCGAPPAPGFVPPPGQFSYQCPYCKHGSLLGTPIAAPPPQHHAPSVIVVRTPHFDPTAMAHAHAARSASWVIWLIVVLVVSLGSGGAALFRSAASHPILSGLVWDGSEPLHCTGNDDVTVSGVTGSFTSGSAISATGNCHVKCTNCKLSAPTAIEASGNGQVTIVGGAVTGTSVLADASGNGRITFSGNVTARGTTRQSGNGKVAR